MTKKMAHIYIKHLSQRQLCWKESIRSNPCVQGEKEKRKITSWWGRRSASAFRTTQSSAVVKIIDNNGCNDRAAEAHLQLTKARNVCGERKRALSAGSIRSLFPPSHALSLVLREIWLGS